MKHLLFALLLAAGAQALGSCGKKDCRTEGCPPGQQCVETSGQWACEGPPPPTTLPPPTTTTLPADVCHFTEGDVTEFRNEVKPYAGASLDFTVIACHLPDGPPPCNNPVPGLNRCCPLSLEKGNQQCSDELFGPPWVTPWPDVSLNGLTAGQGLGAYTFKPTSGSGFVSICGPEATLKGKTGACIKIHVAPGVPACDVDPTTGVCKVVP